MVSKGIDTYVSLSSPVLTVRLEVRGSSPADFTPGMDDGFPVPSHRHDEIDSSDLGLFEKSGRYTMRVMRGDAEIVSRFAEVNPLTGNVGDSNLDDMLRTTSLIGGDHCISYGFFDAGKGESHQAYVAVTGNRSRWMGELLDRHPGLRQRPFGSFVLPGSHDAGMFCGVESNGQARQLLAEIGLHEVAQRKLAAAGGGAVVLVNPALHAPLAALASLAVAAEFVLDVSRRLLINLAYTQKDDIVTQLALGIRHFDFRPGRKPSFCSGDDELRHQHGFVPGYAFRKFLDDVARFLVGNEQEIVVVNTKFDGFMSADMKPSRDELEQLVDGALAAAGGPALRRGGLEDYGRPVEALLADNRRLIIVYDGDGDSVVDSYGDAAYATNDPCTITGKLAETLAAPGQAKLMVLQLQGTYTGAMNKVKDLPGYLLTGSEARSPLLRTKARFDQETFKWLRENAARFADLPPSCGVVLLDDFVDGTLSEYAARLTLKRAGLG